MVEYSMQILFILLIIFILLLFGIFYFFKKYLSFKKPKLKYLPASSEYKFIALPDDFNSYDDIGVIFKQCLNKNKVKQIFLVHGTFVGDDPFHIIELIERLFPKLSKKVIYQIRDKTKLAQDTVAKDVGNFVNEHVETLQLLTDYEIPICNFKWSSGNTHYARVISTFDLINKIAADRYKGERVLLIGHSHAGQLFALMTQMLAKNDIAYELAEIVSSLYEVNDLESKLSLLQTMHFDFVTMGSPPRYKWFLSDHMHLLHIINHRGTDIVNEKDYFGALTTRSGDYIQQWGVEGSDMISPSRQEQSINKKLEPYLGAGANLDVLRKKIERANRFHNTGMHLLVDYQDGGGYPNFIKTIFGHGVYTRLRLFNFHISLILEHLYQIED